MSPYTVVDEVGLLVDLLVAFGNLVGPGPHMVADGAAHTARLNSVLVGSSSRSRKGTARANIGRLLMEVDPDWAADDVTGGVGSGEGIVASLNERPKVDFDGRMLVVEPEFSRLLAVSGRDGSIVSQILRDAWDTGDLRVMTRKNPLRVDGAHVSVVGHITIEELRQKLSKVDSFNGFGNRFLWCLVRRSKLLPSGAAMPPELAAQIVRRLQRSAAKARVASQVRRSRPAEAQWVDIYQELSDGLPGTAGAMTARAEAQVLRLSIAFALLDGHSIIRPQHQLAALAVWRYAERSAEVIFGDAPDDPRAAKGTAARSGDI
jgi:hypothetical protein